MVPAANHTRAGLASFTQIFEVIAAPALAVVPAAVGTALGTLPSAVGMAALDALATVTGGGGA